LLPHNWILALDAFCHARLILSDFTDRTNTLQSLLRTIHVRTKLTRMYLSNLRFVLYVGEVYVGAEYYCGEIQKGESLSRSIEAVSCIDIQPESIDLVSCIVVMITVDA
jgi:hypothetical protein